MKFGTFIRRKRESLRLKNVDYSLRKVAARIGVEPAYLSKVERNEVKPPSEEKIVKLARELGEDHDTLLARAGKVSGDLREIIRTSPRLYGSLLRKLDADRTGRLAAFITLLSRGDNRPGTNEKGGHVND